MKHLKAFIGKHNIDSASTERLFIVFPVGKDCRYIRDDLGFKPIRNKTYHQYFILTYNEVSRLSPFTDKSSMISEVTNTSLDRKDLEDIIRTSTKGEILEKIRTGWN